MKSPKSLKSLSFRSTKTSGNFDIPDFLGLFDPNLYKRIQNNSEN